MPPGHASVFDFLSASPSARTHGVLDLGFGRFAALWRNDSDHVTYAGAHGHTFSLYLKGGHGTRRVDGRAVAGWPGAFCVMPHCHRSEWTITAPFSFVHLYLPADELRRTFAETFERDARMLDVADVTFAEAPRLAATLLRIAASVEEGDPLAAEAAMVEMVTQFLVDPRWGGVRRRTLTGGLAPHLGRRIADYVEGHLHRTIRLADLATIAGLSPFHLQRAFRASRGVSPQVFVAHRRIERAKALLRGREPVAAIALACGFSSQSHLTHAFRMATGLTPAAYRTRT
ncbi:helix-turn-helix transcriptional regulator [Methylobacterium sp. WL103]|uniref:helix-turn-helix domain-containing protein n=1 Tax=Methylobacterium sp. WL103 TaxID=2603891 RepID=UPI0011CB02AE|nr:AraC family transcriptional regulator [Methylobacterium sp. WL103]TXM96253.1 helix-turn-helix transcriptional regulator [Methylobacterium sp. WL103]